MDEAPGCFLLVVGHRRRGVDHPRILSFPDVIRVGYFRKAWVIWAPGCPVIQSDLLSSVFGFIFGQFPAPGVNLFDRFLTGASSLLLILVVACWFGHSVVGVG